MTNDPVTNTLLGGGLIAMIAAAWNQIKNFANRMAAVAVVTVHLQPEVRTIVCLFIKANFKFFYGGTFFIDSGEMRITGEPRRQHVPYLLSRESGFVWRRQANGRLLVLHVEGSASQIKALRPFDIQAFIIEALTWHKELINDKKRQSSCFYSEVVTGTADEDMWGGGGGGKNKPSSPRAGSVHASQTSAADDSPAPTIGTNFSTYNYMIDKPFMYRKEDLNSVTSPLEHLFYEPEVLSLIDDAKKWLGKMEWYRERGIPWRRGLLVYGPPGTGKSSLSVAMAQTLDIPLVVFRLSTMTDRDLTNAMSSSSAPRVILFEDFDTIWHGRVNQTEHKRLSFDCVLNVLSGVNATDGYYLIITTNDVSKLDPAIAGSAQIEGQSAISTRPGRIDKTIELNTATESCRLKILHHTLDGLSVDFDDLVAKSEGFSVAQTQELAVQTAFHHID